MIRAVIFDVGGVLIRTADYSHRRNWEKELGLREWEAEEIVFGSEMSTQAQCGGISEEALWTWVGERLGLAPEGLRAFRQGFWAGDVLDTALIGFIRSLRPDYQTAIISNATDNLRLILAQKYPIDDAFDLIVCSAEERVMKPDPRIYNLTLDRLGREPAEAVFIDDSAPNVAAARELGMHAIHFSAGVDVAAELAKLGVWPAGNEDNV